MEYINRDDLMSGLSALQNFVGYRVHVANTSLLTDEQSDSYPQKNRAIGSPAHLDTINYIYDSLGKTGYFDIKLQAQTQPLTTLSWKLWIDGAEYETAGTKYDPQSKAFGYVVSARNYGCSLVCVGGARVHALTSRLADGFSMIILRT